MSTFSLTRSSEAALGMLASQAGSETLLLTQPARELRAEISIEPFAGESGNQLLAVLFMREQRHSMTLQRDDGANAQHLADWIEAVANGTVDTAEAIPQRADPSDLAAATAAFNAAAHELNAQAEAAPAQDERDAPEVVAIPCCSKDGDWYIDALHPSRLGEHGYLAEGDELMTVAQHERIIAALARPAQTEQQPVAWLHSRSGAVATEATKRAMEDGSVPSGYDIPLYAAPAAQTAANPEQSGLVEALKKHRIALTPEYEGQWHAELYAGFEAPLFTAEGDTPEDAVEAVVRKAQADRPTA